ncbi:Ger(x)C family spore germination protein [Bacillus sp. S3]|uniref:Ger(x)C family spore germination protein n=1 Tax=Bacillus sp. S3 TaxID=486398 RepID=UPI00118CA97C|nr:Ger(x)C family spore germination protein [Bacillus sp. S3]QCJ41048.1 Ger(x)C family spore germination protein [Bacillus sp. S3]
MRRTIRRLLVICCIPIILTGCWDQRLLKEQKLILLVGFDLNQKGEVTASTAYPIGKGGIGKSNSPATTKSTILTTKGKTALESLLHADFRISERIDISKTRVVLFGEQLAKKGIYPELDHIYRNPKGALGAKVAIIQGEAIDAVRINQEEADLNGQYYDEFLKSGEATGFYTNFNVQSVCPLLLKHTKDPLLPLIEVHKNSHRAHSVGMALFNNEKMTGKLNITEAKMFMLLSGKKNQKVSLWVMTSDQQKVNQENFVIIEILHTRQKTKLKVNNDAVTANISLKLQYRISEYPKNHLTNSLLLQQLNKEIKKSLTKTAERTIAKLQKANCDGLGIEEEIKVHHTKLWEKKYKNVAFKEIPIKTKLEFELINSGIIN